MQTRFLIAAATGTFLTVAGSLPAQIYDNGPINHTATTSILQIATPYAGNVFGWGAQTTAANRMADDFTVCGGGMVITDIELFSYQTGSTTASTITGMFVEIWAGDPNLGALPVAGSPGFATNLFTTGGTLVSNTFSGYYRVPDSALTLTNRPIMRVRCALTTPITLAAGTYQIGFNFAGTLASGPWAPPIVILNQMDTGNARQAIAAAAYAPISNSVTAGLNPTGMPFRFYGTGNTPGSITLNNAGCSSPAALNVRGAPALGGRLVVEMTGSASIIPFLGYGFSSFPGGLPICANGFGLCLVGHPWTFAFAFTTLNNLVIPVDPGLCGAVLSCQGAEFGGADACASPLLSFTASYNVAIQS